MRGFKDLHPLVVFIFFVAVIGISMAVYNPLINIISCVGSLVYYYKLKGSFKGIIYFIPMAIFIAVLNPIFSHKGNTILFYLGNPITLEAILYGIGAGLMIFGVIVWFGCFNIIMTGDKIVYIFGKIIPKGSLIMSMVLSMVPRVKRQFNSILEGQRALGYNIKEAKFKDKIIIGGRAVSGVLSYILEGSVVRANSMEARGYGKKGRSNYSIFEMTTRDKAVGSAVVVCAVAVIIGIFSEGVRFEYYPVIYCESILRNIFYYICFGTLAFIPFVL